MEAIYARQSIDKKESLSIEGQIDLCRKECKLPESAIVYQDRGYSGKNTKRPEFEQMLLDVKEGKVHKIIVYRLDRFSRSITDFSRIWVQLEEKGVEFVSVNERFDTSTPMGKAMLYIIMVFAQLERETIAERVKDNYYQRSKRGNWPGGPAPFGFKNVKVNAKDGHLTPSLEVTREMDTVIRIFNEYATKGVTLGSIAKQLTEEKIVCRNRNHWDNVAISRILHNPVYVKADENIYLYYAKRGVNITNGIEEFDGTLSAHIVGKRTASERKFTEIKNHTVSLTNFEGIIPSDLWVKCQTKLSQNTQIKNAGKGQYTWLTGVLKCAKCGYAISLKYARKSGRIYMGCSGHLSNHMCGVVNFSISLEDIETAVEKEMKVFFCKFHRANIQLTDNRNSLEINDKLQKIDERIHNLIYAMSNASSLSIGYINEVIEILEKERKEMLQQVIEIESDNQRYPEINFSKLGFDLKKYVVGTLIDKIKVFDDGIEICWRV